MTTDPLLVRHTAGEYPVHVVPGLLGTAGDLVNRYLPDRRLAVIADATVAALYQAPFERRVDLILTFPPGEASKSRDEWARLTDQLLTADFGRDSGIVALGGGVAGDLAGFVAATYLRGVPFVQVPTTLLAMVDASVGGKTGVDTGAGKNLVGAFHQPQAVLADPRVLTTLSDADFRAGLAEAVKHAIMTDAAHFAWLESNAASLVSRDPTVVTALVRRSVAIKAAVVAGDEQEQGRRAILNAGHTVGHALEQVSGYRLSHGEAVALGLVAEARLAVELGVANDALPARVAGLLDALGLPTRLAEPLPAEQLAAALRQDKKNRAAQIRCALPARLGEPARDEERWTTGVPMDRILAAIAGLA